MRVISYKLEGMKQMSPWPLKDEVKAKVHNAIEHLLQRDGYLLSTNVNERSISHKLATYLQIEFGGEWDVDCEYNRNHDVSKRLDLSEKTVRIDDTEGQTVFPDIVVHHRGSDDNLLVIEIKKAGNLQGKDFDLKKLSAFKQQLHYRYTLFLQFKVGQSIGIDEEEWNAVE